MAELVTLGRVRLKAGLRTGLLLEWEPNDSNAVPVSVDEIRVRVALALFVVLRLRLQPQRRPSRLQQRC